MSSRGWCKMHYRRWERNGSPTGGIAYKGEKVGWLERHAAHRGAECLQWPYFINPNGYGAARHLGKSTPAHRLMCELAHGKAPDHSYEAAHSCRLRSCVNPSHLRWATRSENMHDNKRDGTERLGTLNNHNKLAVDDVIAIRQLQGATTLKVAADCFGVAISTVHRIWRREGWAWL